MQYISANFLELLGLLSGVLCVVLLVRENVWTFPIGLAYSVITVIVVARSYLYADVVLNLYYVAMNAYGWYFWLRGGADRRVKQDATLQVAQVPGRLWIPIAGVGVLGTALMGVYFDQYTQADLAYLDSATTIASFIAMWMSARKYIESWLLWFAIDVVQVGLYLYKGIEAYALLYFIYLGLAIWGWQAWQRSARQASAHG